MLDKADVVNVGEGAAVWEKVVRKLRAGQMPPAGMPRPDKTTTTNFVEYLETALDRAVESNPNPGRPSSVHRLNRTEYSNAVRDLLAVEMMQNHFCLPTIQGTDLTTSGMPFLFRRC
jgi:hypothetical protein